MTHLCCKCGYLFFVCNVRLAKKHPIQSNSTLLDGLLEVDSIADR